MAELNPDMAAWPEGQEPKEETKQGIATETQDPVAEEVKTENKPTEESVFDISSLNSRFSRSFESEDDLKSIFEKADKYAELEDKYSETENNYKSTQEKLSEYEKYLDPKSMYSNEHLYRLDQILKKYPDLDPVTAAEIDNFDLNTANPIDLVSKGLQLDTPGIKVSDAVAKQVLADELKVEVEDLNDLNALQNDNQVAYFKLMSKANSYKQKFSEMKTVEDAKPFDIEAIKQEKAVQLQQQQDELKSKWKPILNKEFSDLKEIKIDDEYSFKVDESYAKDMLSKVLDDLVENGVRPTEANVKAQYSKIENDYFNRNREKIMSDYRSHIETKFKEQEQKDLHNPQPTNTTEAPPRSSVDSMLAASQEAATNYFLGK